MNKRLLWKLCVTIAAGTVILFWAVDILTSRTEQHMSHITEEFQQELMEYGRHAESIYYHQGEDALEDWLTALQEKEKTWAAVVSADLMPLAGGMLSSQFQQGFRLGRSVEWKVHLYFKDNPIMDMTFSDPGHIRGEGRVNTEGNHSMHFLMQLPQRMRPGVYLKYTNILLQFALPLILLIALSVVIYRHVMTPLKRLEKATRQFSDGQYDVRVGVRLGSRNDELAALAKTFDSMATRTGNLIIAQRQLISDFSHELRTPLARLDMAVDCVTHGIKPEESLRRLKYESLTMRHLVEDALTLAWLTNEEPQLNSESLDLVELLGLIVDDARFEYPDRVIYTDFPSQAILPLSSHRALGQAFENVIRNALKHSPLGCAVYVSIHLKTQIYEICVRDEGPGVPESYLEDIFKPFFRLDKSRQESALAGIPEKSQGGYGLGLALAQRQIHAVKGNIRACNCFNDGSGKSTGLAMIITLPL